MARIDVKWSEPTLNTYDHINTADFFTALPADFKADGKPLLIYVTSTKDEDKIETQNIESSVLRDESVTIGATMFRSIKVKGSSINKGHPFYATLGGKELPAMIVVDANGQKVGAEEGKISASKVFGLMKRAAARTYKVELDTIVKETKAILTDIDNVEAKRTALATKREKSTNDRSAQWAKEEKELDAAMKEIEAAAAGEWIEFTPEGFYVSHVTEKGKDKVILKVKYDITKDENGTVVMKPVGKDEISKKELPKDLEIPVTLKDDSTIEMKDPKKKMTLIFKRKA